MQMQMYTNTNNLQKNNVFLFKNYDTPNDILEMIIKYGVSFSSNILLEGEIFEKLKKIAVPSNPINGREAFRISGEKYKVLIAFLSSEELKNFVWVDIINFDSGCAVRDKNKEPILFILNEDNTLVFKKNSNLNDILTAIFKYSNSKCNSIQLHTKVFEILRKKAVQIERLNEGIAIRILKENDKILLSFSKCKNDPNLFYLDSLCIDSRSYDSPLYETPCCKPGCYVLNQNNPPIIFMTE